VRRALGAEHSGDLTAPGVALAWSGPAKTTDTPVALAGWIQNLPALARELGVESGLDPEVAIATGCARWSKDTPTRLRGQYALAAWDTAADTCLLAVDHLGAGAIFLHDSGGTLRFATELDLLLRLLPARPIPSRGAVAGWLADGYLETGETLYEGITRLPGGHLIRASRGRFEIVRYWTPAYTAPDARTLEESAAVLRTELERAVGERLPATGVAGVLMGGGLDSSTVVGVATSLTPTGTSLRGLSLAYPDHPEADETPFVDELARALRLEVDRLEVRGADALGASLELHAFTETPMTTPMSAFTFPLLELARRAGIDHVLDGEGGDELFGCSPYLIADRLIHGRLRSAAALARRLPGSGDPASRSEVLRSLGESGLKGVLPHGAHRLARRVLGARRYAPAWLAPASAGLYVAARDEWSWKRLPGPRWWAFQADLLTTWRERLGVHDYLRTRDAIVGVSGRHPLLDDVDLIELVLRLPPEHAFDPRLTRPVARESTRGLLPDVVRLRSDKADMSRLLVESLAGVGLSLARDLLACPRIELAAHVQKSYVSRVLAVPNRRRNVSWARLLWRFATTEAWLRSQSDPDGARSLLEAHRARLSAAAGG
jgi:asparagine synthetase B (glutamine-hydrolysing)